MTVIHTVLLAYVSISFLILIAGMAFDVHKKLPLSHTVWSILWIFRLFMIGCYALDKFLYSVDIGNSTVDDEFDDAS